MKRAVAIAAGLIATLFLGTLQAQAGAGLAPDGLKRAVIDFGQIDNPAAVEKVGYRFRRHRGFRRHGFRHRRHHRRHYRRHYGYYGYGGPSYRYRYYRSRRYYGHRHHRYY